MANPIESPLENQLNHTENTEISNNIDSSNNQNIQTCTEIPINNGKISLGSIKTVFHKFFKDDNILNYSPKDIEGKLWSLLMEENYKPSPETIQSVRHLPGDAVPITDQSTDKSEQNSNELSTKDKKEKNDKEPKESKELKESKDLKEKLKEKDKELKEFKEKEKEYEKILQKCRDNENQLRENYMKHIKSIENKARENEEAWANVMNQLNSENSKLNSDISKLKQINNAWSESCAQLDEQLKNKKKELSDLYKKNEELKNEASQYQSALGDARNYRLGDNDANNPTQLTREIGIIQDKINEFCKLKGGVEINEQNLARLLSERFNCKYETGDKVLPKAALQRVIIEKIIARTIEYMSKGSQLEMNDNKIVNKYLELDFLNSTNNYLSKINTLIKLRTGTDEVSFAAPKKIHQLVYAVLGDRGFGLSNDRGEHEFVQELKDEIIDFMSQFRKIKKADKKKENEDMLADIIRNVIKMFIFRIKVLEPPAELIWIEKDAKVDATLMEVGSLEDDNYDDWVVNLCSFPLICVNPNSETDRKVLVPAKILGIKIEQKSSLSKMKNFFISKPQQSGTDEVVKPTKKNSVDS
ncbi:hypothetical protein RclHR1_01320008 [Rhizophagus clarus]|uniref:Uncharacterized protein n=1 Tax=Rhizophagus clarus TaxID=94130 RepID=A0A2Z6Q9F0_9GLOM|nr:hypothetical protein RclHR1_01320008 [Rhizophagus clarus]GES81275.1 hypothetical protein GLOIN_2v1762614 [Rhizophagus clarus]